MRFKENLDLIERTKQMEKVKTILLLKDGFEDAEAIVFVDFLHRMEIDLKIVSCTKERTLHSYFGLTMQADLLFDEIKDQVFDLVAIVGGPNNTTALEQDQEVVAFIKKHDDLGKLIAAECSAPAKVLGHNHLIKERNYVCSSGLESTVDNGKFVDQPVVVDQNLITCKGLGHTFEFAAIVALALGCDRKAVEDQHFHIYCDPDKLSQLIK